MLAGELDAVIVSAGEAYVQFAVEEGLLRCEAAGDEYLSAPLNYEQLLALSRLRFLPPERGGHGNHSQTLMSGEPEEAARLAIEALVTVYGADREEVEVQEV